MRAANQLPEGSPLMWMMLLHLHVKSNADDGDDNDDDDDDDDDDVVDAAAAAVAAEAAAAADDDDDDYSSDINIMTMNHKNCEKIRHRGFRPSPTQIELCNYRR